MNFQLIGVNHKTAPVDVRERFAIPESHLPNAVQQLVQHPCVGEGLILSTCNRVEMLVRTNNGSADLCGFLGNYFQLDAAVYKSHLYEYHGRDAVEHLFRVAASLDSLVVGEPQILGQVKEAYATARAVGAMHSQLDQLVTRAFAVAKRVRSQTAVGSSAVSVASVAVELAEKVFGSLRGKTVFLVGAGKMSELAARHLLTHGADSIFVANRSYDRAVQLAEKFNGRAILYEQLYETCNAADIVITSTGAPFAIFRREHGELFLSRRKNRPIFFIDIAVPRDVDPDMNKLDGIFVYNIDDLQEAVSSKVADREKEAERAEEIVRFEVERFHSRVQTLDMVPTIVSLQDCFETIRKAEVDQARGRLGPLTQEQELAIETLTRRIVKKIIHSPISALKTASEPEATTLAGMAKRLFNLHLCDKNSQMVQNPSMPTRQLRTPVEKTGHRPPSREPLSLAGL